MNSTFDQLRALVVQSPLSTTPSWGMALSTNESSEDSLNPSHNPMIINAKMVLKKIICLILNEREGPGSQSPIQHQFREMPSETNRSSKMSLRNIISSTLLQKLTYVIAQTNKNSLNGFNASLKFCLTLFNLMLLDHFELGPCFLLHLLNNQKLLFWESTGEDTGIF